MKMKKLKFMELTRLRKKDRIAAVYLHVYMELKMRRNVFRKLLNYVKDLKYLEEVVKKEEKILRILFGYLENLVRNLNISNCFCRGRQDSMDFDLNREFYNSYAADSKDRNPVKFKYLVYYIVDNFYRKKIKNIENKIGKRIEEMNAEKYGKDGKEEEKLKEIYEDLYNENDRYYEFIFRLVFGAIKKETSNLKIFHMDYEADYKYELQKFYNLQNMLRTVYEFIRDFAEKSIEKSRVKYYKDVIYCLKNERAMLHKIYEFIMSYVPNLKDKEKFIKADFEKFSEEEKEEIKNNKDPVVIRDDLWQLINDGFPFLNNKEISEVINEDFSENSSIYDRGYHKDGFFNGTDTKYSGYTFPEMSMMENNNFNSVFNEIESAVDEYGNLKENNTINNESESESNEEILRKLEKYYRYLVKEGASYYMCETIYKLLEEYRYLVKNSTKQPESNNKDSILNKLYKLLNETINFYFDEKNGKFFVYDTFYRTVVKKAPTKK